MLSKKQVAVSIDKAERQFDWAWKVLKNLGGPKADGLRLIEVQKRLIEAQWILDAQYKSICRERIRLIENKRRYNSRWFASRMSKCDSYLKVVKSTIDLVRDEGMVPFKVGISPIMA